METEIIIKANLTDEQLEVLVSEIRSTAEMIGVDLKVESNKLSQHDVSGRSEQFVCGANRVMEEKIDEIVICR